MRAKEDYVEVCSCKLRGGFVCLIDVRFLRAFADFFIIFTYFVILLSSLEKVLIRTRQSTSLMIYAFDLYASRRARII